MQYKTIEFKGKKINYRLEGTAQQTLVLLHGYMNSLSVWDKFFDAYKDKIRVLAIDLIGHGESEVVEAVSSMELQSDMIRAVLNAESIFECVMVGHSMGGMITLCFAERYPQYLKGFCLLHSQAMGDNPKGKENRIRACKLVNENRIKYIVDFIPNLFAPENEEKFAKEIEELKTLSASTCKEGIIAAQMGMIERRDRQDILEHSKVPVLFIIGKQDIRADLLSVLAQASLPEFAEVLLLNCGHMSFIEEEQVIKHRLLSFTDMCFSLNKGL
ncbi:MAG: alpha/beta hydrolase [Bacteroidales bacterium]|nr:alpha/beta hydrolase [Bacteroidales bacterium]